MKAFSVGFSVFAIIGLLWASSVFVHADDANESETEEQKITVQELPKSIQNALKGVKVAEVETEIYDGKKVYEVEIIEGDVEFEMVLDSEGRLIGVEVEHRDAEKLKDDEK